ncbi:YesL family protein [Paenibacillus psychroresistens]|uniref:YesL family protein n=1 Tax=Paenibacillus psychroresistens TaxID=1778678 RepID=UPI0013911003|nr:DUF624 domain-containing protein [Paenibacillus psychroresistens]
MEFKGMMGGLYKITEWIMRLAVINLLWIACSIPFVFIAIVVLLTPAATTDTSMDSLIWGLIFLAIIAPFTIIPASSAMFSVARKWVTGDEDVPLLKTFFRSYKENYRQAMIGGFIFVILAAILTVNMKFYSGNTINSLGFLVYLFIVLFVFLIAAFFNFLSILAHFHMKIWQIIKNSILLTLGNPIQSIGILVVNAFIIFIGYRFGKGFMYVFFTGSLIAYSTFWQFNRNLQKIQTKFEKQNAEKELLEQETKGNEIK